MMPENRLLIFGLGYSGKAVMQLARTEGFTVTGTSRSQSTETIPFEYADAVLATATHILVTAPPGADGDPVLARYRQAIAEAPALRWIGYLSSTVVYGNRNGGWVDEDTPPAPGQDRGVRRLVAEDAWQDFADRKAVVVFRVAGIYGPNRSAFDDLRAGRARRVIKPGHKFGRIHRDDLARAVVQAMTHTSRPGSHIFNLSDDEPAESASVVTEASRLLGTLPPPATLFDEAWLSMSPMARSFWSEERQVSAVKTKKALGLSWLYPTFREGLKAILAAETSSEVCSQIDAGGSNSAPIVRVNNDRSTGRDRR